MKCYKHPDRDAVGMCVGCGNPICQQCNVKLDEDNCCEECKGKLAATTKKKKQPSKRNKWLLGLLIGCGTFMFIVMIGGILAAMLLPALSRAKGQARKTVCLSNLSQIGVSLHMYAQENGEHFPENLSQLYPDYVSDPKVFWCRCDPDDRSPQDIKTPEDAMISYTYVPSLNTSEDSDTPVVFEHLQNHENEGGNVLFIDGHVEWKEVEEFEKSFPSETLTAP